MHSLNTTLIRVTSVSKISQEFPTSTWWHLYYWPFPLRTGSINTGTWRLESQFNRCGRKSSRCRSLFFAKAKYVTLGTLLNILTSNVLTLFLDPWIFRSTSRSHCFNNESSDSNWFWNVLNKLSVEPTKPIFGWMPKNYYWCLVPVAP